MDKKSLELRKLMIEATLKSKRAHLSSAFSIAEIIRVLYHDILKLNKKNINNLNRNRFILSKGHGCLALYAALFQKNFISKKLLLNFCTFDTSLPGHPEHGVPGVEASTGSLGHGLSIGIGLALSARILKKKFNVFVLLGDGELNEGSVWEGLMSAAHHKIKNLTIIIDKNNMQSYDFTKKVVNLDSLKKKFLSFNLDVIEINGHSIPKLKKAFKLKNNTTKVIIANTVKGKGIKELESNSSWHHKSRLTDEEINFLTSSLKNKLK